MKFFDDNRNNFFFFPCNKALQKVSDISLVKIPNKNENVNKTNVLKESFLFSSLNLCYLRMFLTLLNLDILFIIDQSSDILQHPQNRPTGDRWQKF